jgi:hypothetical protein
MTYIKLASRRAAWKVALVGVGVALLAAASATAQGDPSIIDWGSPPGFPPPHSTPDIWVDNNGNGIQEAGEPSKGATNFLFAKVRNLGASAVEDVSVRFAYAPYGMWGWASYADFKEIQVVTVSLAAAGDPGDEKSLQVSWDLTDLTEDNGGAWGGYEVGDFNHFCIWVKVEYGADANPANNDARNNFTNVPISAGDLSELRFLMANPRQEPATAELVARGIPESWEFELQGAQLGRFTLEPGEFRLVSVALRPPADAMLAEANIDISARVNGETIGGISFEATEADPVALFPPSGGSLGPYLAGTWDLRKRRSTVVQVVNPTARPLELLVALFDDNEKPVGCVRESLSANDLAEIDIRRHLDSGFGVVKIVSFGAGSQRPEAGVIGFQRTFSRCFWCTRLRAEAPLAQIPAEVLEGELELIRRACG